MIKLQDYTPDVYYNQSRDFQFIGRLFDLVLNYSKSNSDLIYNLPLNENSNQKLIDLLTLSLGFKARHRYNTKQLTILCSIFNFLLKNKGNIYAIQVAGDALLAAEGIINKFSYTISETENLINLILFVPQELSDINLLSDLLTYILPAGITCTIYRSIQETSNINTTITTDDSVKFTYTNNTYAAIPNSTDLTNEKYVLEYPNKTNNAFSYPDGSVLSKDNKSEE